MVVEPLALSSGRRAGFCWLRMGVAQQLDSNQSASSSNEEIPSSVATCFERCG